MGIFSSLINAASQASTNEYNQAMTNATNAANMRIAQMNNEYNERQFQKQIDYNWQMWNATNEYNSAANQRKRLEEAGIPAWTMSGQNAGTASVGGSVSPPRATDVNMQAPRKDPVRFDFDLLGDVVSKIMGIKSMKNQSDIQQEQLRGMQIDNATRSLENMSRIKNLIANTDNLQSKTKYQGLLNDTFMQQFNAEMLYKERMSANLLANTELSITQRLLQSKELQYFDQQKRAELSILGADLALKVSQKKLTERQAATEIQKAILTGRQAYGQKLDNDTAYKIGDALIREATAKAFNAENNQGPDNIWQFTNTLLGGKISNFGSGVGKGLSNAHWWFTEGRKKGYGWRLY